MKQKKKSLAKKKMKILYTLSSDNNVTIVYFRRQREITNRRTQIAAHCSGAYIKGVRTNRKALQSLV